MMRRVPWPLVPLYLRIALEWRLLVAAWRWERGR